MEKQHYGLPTSPAVYSNKLSNRNKFMCHACTTIRDYNSGMCECRQEGATKKKLRKFVPCKYCGKAVCDKGLCFRSCNNCTAKIKNVYSHDNHRCIVHDKSVPEVLLETGVNTSKERKFKLWAYDLESRRVFEENSFTKVFKRGENHLLTENLELIIEKKVLQKPNLVIFQNIFDPAEKHMYFGDSCLEMFITFMIGHNNGYNICVAHNASGYDTQLISEQASLMKVKKKAITSGLKFTQLQIGNSFFRDSMLHLQGSLASLAKNFNLQMMKGYFPHLFNVEGNYDYVGDIPNERFFDLVFSAKKESDVNAFREWYDERKQRPWCFKEELIKYCKNDVEILAQIMKLFHDICIDRFGSSPWFHPTAPSFCHRTIIRNNTTKLHLPEDAEELTSTINQLSKEHWACLVPQEYWFARRALIGGRTDVKKIHHRLSEEDIAAGRSIVYQDIVSMYPFVQAQRKFLYPVGTPIIYIFDENWYPCLKHQGGDKTNTWKPCKCSRVDKRIDGLVNVKEIDLQFTETQLIEKQYEMFGIWCVSLKPPKNLFHPVLCVYDKKTKKRVATLEDLHEEVFTSIEIVKALEKGYKLIKVHRMDVYKAKQGLWTDFIKKLYIDKMANSEKTPSEEEQTRLVNAYEQRFGMGKVVKDSFPDWDFRPALRLTFKIMLNSGWGKHCTRVNLPMLSFLDPEDDEEMAELYEGISTGEINITGMTHQGNNLCVRTIASNRDLVPHDLYIPAGLFVPAYGRLMLYDALDILGDRVLYHDTDSVIYIHDPAKQNLDVDDIWGSWSEESVSKNGNILAFVGLGAKSYAIKTRDGDDIIKLKGIALKRSHEKQINFDTLEDLLMRRGLMNVPQMSMPYKIGIGKSIEEYVKVVRFDPEELKGTLHTDMRVYPPGYCQGCLENDVDHTC